jgi:hypothetical protein
LWDTSNPYLIVQSITPNPGAGIHVDKVGRTSGWTSGYVVSTCHDVSPDTYPSLKILCQTEATTYWDRGDSGGPVFVSDGRGGASLVGTIALGIPSTSRYFSPMSQITGMLTSSMSIVRGVNLSTPSISGSVSGSYPLISWSAVSGASRYQLFRIWCVWTVGFTCSSGSDGWEYVGDVYGTSYLDAEMTVSAYNGASLPGVLNYGYVGYYFAAAVNTIDYSAPSNTIFFVLSP